MPLKSHLVMETFPSSLCNMLDKCIIYCPRSFCNLSVQIYMFFNLFSSMWAVILEICMKVKFGKDCLLHCKVFTVDLSLLMFKISAWIMAILCISYGTLFEQIVWSLVVYIYHAPCLQLFRIFQETTVVQVSLLRLNCVWCNRFFYI